MRALLASVVLAIALCAAMVAVYMGDDAIRLYTALEQHPNLTARYRDDLEATLIFGGIFIVSILWSVFLDKKAIIHIGARKALFQVIAYSGVLLVVLPNVLLPAIIWLSIHNIDSFFLNAIAMVGLSLYYEYPATIFGNDLFLTETVVWPEGIGGYLASAAYYAVVVIVSALVVHFFAWKLASRKRMHIKQASKPDGEG